MYNIIANTSISVKCIILNSRVEQDDMNIDIIPHISMANKSWSMSQDPTEDYGVPPDSLKDGTYIPSDDSFDSDDELIRDMPLKKVVHDSEDTLSANDSVVRPESEEGNNMPRRFTMPLPNATLENMLSSLKISDFSAVPQPANGSSYPAQELEHAFDASSPTSSVDRKKYFRKCLIFPLPHKPLQIALSVPSSVVADGQVTKEDIHDHEQMNELSSSSDGYKKVDYGLSDIQNPQEEPLPLTHTTSNNAVQKDTQDNVQGNAETEGYIIEQIDFGHPVTDKMQSTHLDMTGATNAVVQDDDELEYYECCEVKRMFKPMPVASAAAATTKSDAAVQFSSVHKISKSHDRNTMANQSIDDDDTVALNEQSMYDDTKSPTTEVKTSDIPEMRRIDSTTSSYVRMYKVNDPSLKRDSNIYACDYVYHSYIKMCRHRKRNSGVPPRRIERSWYQPSIYVNIDAIKEHPTYVNFRTTERHTIPLPPRENRNRPTPKQSVNYRPPMPPRNIPRPGCFLSAPSALPKTV